MTRRITCPPLEGLRALTDLQLHQMQTEVADNIADIQSQLSMIKELQQDVRPPILRALDTYERCARNIRNLLAERRAAFVATVAPYNDLYDAVAAFLDDDTEASFDGLERAFAAVPVPARHQKKGAA